jgi:hypothetical protein
MWPRLGWSTVTAAVHPKEAVVMSADARRPHDSELTDLIEDAAFLGMFFSGAAIVVTILVLFVLF